MTTTYDLSPSSDSITCRLCGRSSTNLKDIEYRYCSNCKLFHHEAGNAVLTIAEQLEILCPKWFPEDRESVVRKVLEWIKEHPGGLCR